MTPATIVAITLASGASAPGSLILPTHLVANVAFEDGINSRGDAKAARAFFKEAADGFEWAWKNASPSGTPPELYESLIPPAPIPHSPGLALNRGHAHFLAGNVPQAIVAFHEGLALFPYDAELQQSLAAARGTIPYPDAIHSSERVRPDPPRGVRNRVAPWDVFRFAAFCGVLLAVGLGARLTTRPGWAVPVAVLGGVGWLIAGGVAYAMHRERLADEAKPVAVVAVDGVTLRRGNGEAYPPRVEARLPRGAEVRVVGRRGGWVQVELAGGAVGWLPDAGCWWRTHLRCVANRG